MTKEEGNRYKELKKYFMRDISNELKKRGFRKRDNSFYKIYGEIFAHADYIFILTNGGLNFLLYLYVKKISYDNIFWEIMDMKDNLNSADSLRAVGAFKSPSVLINRMKLHLLEKEEYFAEKILDQIEYCINEFISKYSINTYVLNLESEMDEDILKVLVYIDMKMYEKASLLAQQEILKGNKGRFRNEGKGFFELAVKYCNEFD